MKKLKYKQLSSRQVKRLEKKHCLSVKDCSECPLFYRSRYDNVCLREHLSEYKLIEKFMNSEVKGL